MIGSDLSLIVHSIPSGLAVAGLGWADAAVQRSSEHHIIVGVTEPRASSSRISRRWMPGADGHSPSTMIRAVRASSCGCLPAKRHVPSTPPRGVLTHLLRPSDDRLDLARLGASVIVRTGVSQRAAALSLTQVEETVAGLRHVVDQLQQLARSTLLATVTVIKAHS